MIHFMRSKLFNTYNLNKTYQTARAKDNYQLSGSITDRLQKEFLSLQLK